MSSTPSTVSRVPFIRRASRTLVLGLALGFAVDASISFAQTSSARSAQTPARSAAKVAQAPTAARPTR
ncbi:MAG: hypothetical protein IJY15_12610, partial [Thermoguttaceae bacterium]|nr:hypothetical protein [Thermoguttaceae bacterium]